MVLDSMLNDRLGETSISRFFGDYQSYNTPQKLAKDYQSSAATGVKKKHPKETNHGIAGVYNKADQTCTYNGNTIGAPHNAPPCPNLPGGYGEEAKPQSYNTSQSMVKRYQATNKSNATGDTTTTNGTNYTTMALYVIGGGAVGYGASHFGLKGKEIVGLKGMHLNIACGIVGAIAGYLVYNQTNSVSNS